MPESVVLQRALEAAQHLDEAQPPWTDVLEGFRQLVGGDSATFIMCDGAGKLLQIERQGVDAQAVRDYVEHFHAQDILMPLTCNLGAGNWVDPSEVYTQAQLSSNAFYADFMCSHRMRQLVAFMVEGTPARFAALTVQRSLSIDDVHSVTESTQTRQFTEALRQAVRRRQLRNVRAWASADAAFTAFGEALLLVTPSGVVLHLSARARIWLDARSALVLRDGRLQHPVPRLQAAMTVALRQAVDSDEACCLLLPNAYGAVDRLELARADHQMSLGGEGLVLMRLCREPGTSRIEPGLLSTAFGITPAESRVLAALMAGVRPKEFAASHQVSLATVRTQIAALMDKMDCERQTDLIRKAAAFL